MINSICGTIKLMRPQSVLLMMLFVYVPIAIKTSDYMYGFMQVLPFYFLLTGEIILNDYMDLSKDRVNKCHRPLAAGSVSLPLAKQLIYIFLSLAFVCGTIIYVHSWQRLLLFAVVFAILTIYSLFVNRLAVIKTFITAFTTVLCICFAFTFLGFERKILFFSIAAFFYIVSREILMDIRDYEGDKKCGCNTLAVRLGKEGAYKLAVAYMVSSQMIYMFFLVIDNDLFVGMLWLVSIVVLLVAFLIFRKGDSKSQNKITILLWVPMLLAISSIIL